MSHNINFQLIVELNFVPAQEWVRICFELMDLLNAQMVLVLNLVVFMVTIGSQLMVFTQKIVNRPLPARDAFH